MQHFLSTYLTGQSYFFTPTFLNSQANVGNRASPLSTMADQPSSVPASPDFLGLPVELRLHVYSCVLLANDHTQPYDLLQAPAILPDQTLLQINRQIRDESKDLFDVILHRLSHARWLYTIDARIVGKDYRQRQRHQLGHIATRIRICNLEVRIDFPCTQYGPRTPIAFEFGSDKMAPQLITTTSLVARYRTTVLESAILRAIRERYPSPPGLVNGSYLHVYRCVVPFIRIFDELSFFSSLEFWEY